MRKRCVGERIVRPPTSAASGQARRHPIRSRRSATATTGPRSRWAGLPSTGAPPGARHGTPHQMGHARAAVNPAAGSSGPRQVPFECHGISRCGAPPRLALCAADSSQHRIGTPCSDFSSASRGLPRSVQSWLMNRAPTWPKLAMLRKAVQVSGARLRPLRRDEPAGHQPAGHLRGQFTHLGDDEGVERT